MVAANSCGGIRGARRRNARSISVRLRLALVIFLIIVPQSKNDATRETPAMGIVQQGINRRDFLKDTAAGLTLALTIAAGPGALVGEANADTPFAANIWLNIDPDGTITIVSPAAELGQGTFTTLPAIVAEELDADWSKVKLVPPPVWEEKKYGNPENGIFQTTASMATRGYFKPLRIAGAQARRILLDAVALKWGVPVGELTTEPSMV